MDVNCSVTSAAYYTYRDPAFLQSPALIQENTEFCTLELLFSKLQKNLLQGREDVNEFEHLWN